MTNQNSIANYPTTGVSVGTIVAFVLPESYIPSGWLLCNGSAIPKKYEALISWLNANNTPNLCGPKTKGAGGPEQFTEAINDWLLELTGEEYAYLMNRQEIQTPEYDFSFCNIDDSHTHSNHTAPGIKSTCRVPNGQVVEFDDSDHPYNNINPYSPLNYIIYAGRVN